MSPTPAKVHRPIDLPGLTGVRAVAAVIVVVHHLRPLVDAIAPAHIADAVRPVLAGGVPSLDVFFLLSGFIIAHNYAHLLADPAPGAVRNYFHARVARIYPLHVVAFLIFCVVLGIGALQGLSDYTGQEHTPFAFVANLLMLQGLPGVYAWNFPSWSLTVEFAAYLLFPLVAARVLRARWRTALVVAAIALCLQLVVMFGLGGDDLGSTIMGWPRIAGEFTAGAMAWVVWRQRLRPGLWGDVVIVACTVGAWGLLLSGQAWLWTIPLFAIMIPAIACATGPVGRALAHPVTQWGGRLSFAVYLVHIPVFTVAVNWVIPAHMYVHHSGRAALLYLGGIVVVSFALGALLHHGVEEPARRWLRRRFLARRSLATERAASAAPTERLVPEVKA